MPRILSASPCLTVLIVALGTLIKPVPAMAAAAALPLASPAPGTTVDFEADVYPVLKANCISCHNKTTTKADLNMETPALMTKGGETGEGIVPGKADASLIFQAANHTWDSVMPPNSNKVGAVNLTPEELGLLKLWIDSGAKGELRRRGDIAWQPLPPGLNPIYASAVTQDGRWAVCSRANQIFLYDLGTRQFVARLTDPAIPGSAHRDLVQALAFSPDGTLLASGSFQEIKLWKRELPSSPSSEPVATPALSKEAMAVYEALKLAPGLPAVLRADGKHLVVGDAAGVVRVFDAITKKIVRELRADFPAQRALQSLQWDSARQQLEANFQTGFITLTETAGKALADRLQKAKDAIVAGRKAAVEKAAVVPATQAARAAAQKESAEVAALIAAAPEAKADKSLTQKQADAQAKLEKAAKADTDAVAAVKAAESQTADAEEEVKLLDEARAKNAKSLTEAHAALAAANQKLAQLKVEMAKPAALDPARDGIKTVSFAGDGRRIVAVTASGAVKEWAAETGLALQAQMSQPTWKLERVLKAEALEDRVNSLRFSPDGQTLAAGSGEASRSGDITLWDVDSGALTQTWREKHADAVLSLDFSPDGRLLASGGADKAIKISEVPGGKLLRGLEGHTHHVLGVAFRADGRILASAGADNVVKTWDMITGERKKNIDGWDKEVTSIQFVGATDQILTSAGDSRLRLVRDTGPEVRSIASLPDFLFTASTPKMGELFVGGGQDGVLHVWDAVGGAELAQFKAE